jgi:Arc/MetJ family transcription regulator
VRDEAERRWTAAGSPAGVSEANQNRTPGSARGLVGNGESYLNAEEEALDRYTRRRHIVCMKRTNILLDEQLVGKGMRLTGLRTQKALIDHALRELVRRKEQKSVLKLKGKIRWEGDLDELRANRF